MKNNLCVCFSEINNNNIIYYISIAVDEVLPLFGIGIEGMQRIPHIKVNNYVENIVRNYINKDFIMHFRLSRRIVNELTIRFEMSEEFTSLQGILYYFKPYCLNL